MMRQKPVHPETGPTRPLAGRVWILGGSLVVLVVAAPLLAIAWIALFPSENIWPHLASTILPRHAGTRCF